MSPDWPKDKAQEEPLFVKAGAGRHEEGRGRDVVICNLRGVLHGDPRADITKTIGELKRQKNRALAQWSVSAGMPKGREFGVQSRTRTWLQVLSPRTGGD